MRNRILIRKSCCEKDESNPYPECTTGVGTVLGSVEGASSRLKIGTNSRFGSPTYNCEKVYQCYHQQVTFKARNEVIILYVLVSDARSSRHLQHASSNQTSKDAISESPSTKTYKTYLTPMCKPSDGSGNSEENREEIHWEAHCTIDQATIPSFQYQVQDERTTEEMKRK